MFWNAKVVGGGENKLDEIPIPHDIRCQRGTTLFATQTSRISLWALDRSSNRGQSKLRTFHSKSAQVSFKVFPVL